MPHQPKALKEALSSAMKEVGDRDGEDRLAKLLLSALGACTVSGGCTLGCFVVRSLPIPGSKSVMLGKQSKAGSSLSMWFS